MEYLTDGSDVCSEIESSSPRANENVLRRDLRLDNGALPPGDYTDDGSVTSKFPGAAFVGNDDQCLPVFYVVNHADNSVVHVTTGFEAGATSSIAGSFSLNFGTDGTLDGNFTAVHCGAHGSVSGGGCQK